MQNEGSAGKIFADETDLQVALVSACNMLSVSSSNAHARFYKYSTLKATASLERGVLELKASDGFKAASSEVLLGLCIYLVSKIYRKRPVGLERYVRAYEEFHASEASHNLSDSMRLLRGRSGPLVPKGEVYDLNEVTGRVAAEYWNVFALKELPRPTWAEKDSTRVLGFYDSAFNKIHINKALDDERVPLYVLEYVVFHELLHAKHRPHYARGRSLRTTVHTREFKEEEEKYAHFTEAKRWIERNGRFFRQFRME